VVGHPHILSGGLDVCDRAVREGAVTSLVGRKSKLAIETADTVYEQGAYRPVLVEAHPLHATVRLKGTRSSYDIPWGAVWSMAVKAEAERVRREKKGKR
jgi:hypothetical protein